VLASTPTSIAGTTAVVTATVTNAGPSDAAGAVVTLTLPASTTLNSAACRLAGLSSTTATAR
jgi:uncharacterized repeat protein (TIGR01451 family)